MVEKRLYKSRTDRMICGVCGGIANYLNMDPTIVRILAVLLIFWASAGFWAYIVAAVIMPEEP